MHTKKCQLTGKKFVVSDIEEALSQDLGVALPIISPEERIRRSLAFLAENQLFWREAESLFSVFPAGTAFPVCPQEFWQSADWDPFAFGQSFDFKRLFIEQLKDLWKKIPRPASLNKDIRRGRILNNVRNSEDVFLLFNGENCKSCYFSENIFDCNDCLECFHIENCQLCYEVAHSLNCHLLRFSDCCVGCRDSWFLFNCQDCENCLACVNMCGKKYHIFNQAYSEEEYFKKLSEYKLLARPMLENFKESFQDFKRLQVIPHIICDSSKNITGNYLRSSENIDEGYELVNCRDVSLGVSLRNCFRLIDSVECVNVSQSVRAVGVYNGQNLVNAYFCRNVENVSYSAYCSDSRELFGCHSLNGKEFCVFNVQYSRADYLSLISAIKSHLTERNIWASALPPAFSDFSYNHSAAMEFMPLTRVPAKMMGFSWDDSDELFNPKRIIEASESSAEELFSEVPHTAEQLDIATVQDSLFICQMTGRPYQICKEELLQYQKVAVPPPNLCFQQRRIERLSRISAYQLFDVSCALTKKVIRTAFSPKTKQLVADYDIWLKQQ